MVRIKDVDKFRDMVYHQKNTTTQRGVAAAFSVSKGTAAKLLKGEPVYDHIVESVAKQLGVDKMEIAEIVVVEKKKTDEAQAEEVE